MNKKFVSILGILAATAASLVAETLSDGDLKMRLKASRDGSQYKQGEPAEFLLEVSRSDKPQAGIRFWSSVSKDGINPTLNDCRHYRQKRQGCNQGGHTQRAGGSQMLRRCL